jgi:hypothetical protein
MIFTATARVVWAVDICALGWVCVFVADLAGIK